MGRGSGYIQHGEYRGIEEQILLLMTPMKHFQRDLERVGFFKPHVIGRGGMLISALHSQYNFMIYDRRLSRKIPLKIRLYSTLPRRRRLLIDQLVHLAQRMGFSTAAWDKYTVKTSELWAQRRLQPRERQTLNPASDTGTETEFPDLWNSSDSDEAAAHCKRTPRKPRKRRTAWGWAWNVEQGFQSSTGRTCIPDHGNLYAMPQD